MNSPTHTPAPTTLRSRLLTLATWVAVVGGPLGYLIIETAGIKHP